MCQDKTITNNEDSSDDEEMWEDHEEDPCDVAKTNENTLQRKRKRTDEETNDRDIVEEVRE